MSLADDLLEQAEQLATLDPRRPKQANLRRAISASYYALFHLLTAEASSLFVSDAGFRARINRTYNHGDMKKVSACFASNKLPKSIQLPVGYTTPTDLKNVADAFVNLQQARHEADYDLSRSFRRQEAIDFVQRTRQAFSDWEKVK